MTNPFKTVALALFLRGVIFSLLGLFLLAKIIPSLLNIKLGVDVAGGLVGVLLLSIGLKDIFSALKRYTRIRTEKLNIHPIDFLYPPGEDGREVLITLMSAGENPNEKRQAAMIEWLARIYPRLAYLPFPYKSALHSVMVAAGLGVLGVILLVILRVMLPGGTEQMNLAIVLDWYQWIFFILGYLFWVSVSLYGFRNALVHEEHLLPGKIVGLFVVLLIVALIIAVIMANLDLQLFAPPDLGALPAILWAGSLLVILSATGLVMLRAKRAPEHYRVHHDEEFFTVSMHPTDIVNCIKSYTGNLSGGTFFHLGSWKPNFEEHTAVQAGEFSADLHAESGAKLEEDSSRSVLGTLLAYIGILLSMIAGVLLWKSAGGEWNTAQSAVLSLRTPIALFIFGSLLYRLGSIAIAELRWNSVITYCHVTGTFQAQGGMALMHSGDQTVKGSVLTSATVSTKCAYLTSVGFLTPSLAKSKIARIIDQVEPAESVATELLECIRQQAKQIIGAGAPVVIGDRPRLSSRE